MLVSVCVCVRARACVCVARLAQSSHRPNMSENVLANSFGRNWISFEQLRVFAVPQVSLHNLLHSRDEVFVKGHILVLQVLVCDIRVLHARHAHHGCHSD